MNKDVNAIVAALIAEHASLPGGLLPLLHAIQDRLGYIPPATVPTIARGMNLSRAEVHGVITYYHHFRQAPAGKRVLQVCCAESCQACGSMALLKAAEQQLGCAAGETRADGGVSLEPVYCLGLCAASPAVQLDDQLHARVTPESLQSLLNSIEGAQ